MLARDPSGLVDECMADGRGQFELHVPRNASLSLFIRGDPGSREVAAYAGDLDILIVLPE